VLAGQAASLCSGAALRSISARRLTEDPMPGNNTCDAYSPSPYSLPPPNLTLTSVATAQAPQTGCIQVQAEAKSPIISSLVTAKGAQHRELPLSKRKQPQMRSSQHDGQASALSQSSARSSVLRGRERSRIQVQGYASLSHDGKQAPLEASSSADKSTGSAPQEYHYTLSSPKTLQGEIKILLGGQATATGTAAARLEIDLPTGTRIYTWKSGQRRLCVRLPKQQLGPSGLRVRVWTHARVNLARRGFAHAAVKVALTFFEDLLQGGK
jgi:hypothetical protein